MDEKYKDYPERWIKYLGENCLWHTNCSSYKKRGLDTCIECDMNFREEGKRRSENRDSDPLWEWPGAVVGAVLWCTWCLCGYYAVCYQAYFILAVTIAHAISFLPILCSQIYVCRECGISKRYFFQGEYSKQIDRLRYPCPHCGARAYRNIENDTPLLVRIVLIGLAILGFLVLFDMYQPTLGIKGGADMFGFGFVACIVAIAFLSGKFYSKTRIIPRKGGGYIAEKVPAFKLKIERAKDEIEDMKL